MTLIEPRDCKTPQQTRAQIDAIDQELIALLAKRRVYGDLIAHQVPPEAHGRSMDPFLDMMRDRRASGAAVGLDNLYIDRVFTVIAQSYFDRRLAEAQAPGRSFRVD
jgi:isochorismate pyruvate lyase